jgi:quercetin dioxygenase-like cupin family protein
MLSSEISAAVASLPELKVTAATTDAEAMAAVRILGSFNQCMIGLIRFSGLTPWERHPDDELLQVLDGSVDVTVLLDDGPFETTLVAGSLFVVPKGRWHRQNPRPAVSLLFITSMTGNDASRSEDPRRN